MLIRSTLEIFLIKFFTKYSLSLNKNSSSAFTLAEVLITLGIIGVVAALTIPTLVKNNFDMQQKAQYKKAYFFLFNAMWNVKEEVGYHMGCHYGLNGTSSAALGYDVSECTEFFAQLEKKLNTAKTCTNNAYASGCIPYYGPISIAGCGGLNQSQLQNNSTVYVLSDGMILMRYSGAHPIFAIDINGWKPPNKWGYDVFVFETRVYNDSLKLGINRCNLLDDGGKTGPEMYDYAFN